MNNPDVVIIGAGIVGAACAMMLSEHGVRVCVIESGFIGSGATSAGMGHLCVIDDSLPQLELTRFSCERWAEFARDMSDRLEYSQCGTIWVATDDQELLVAKQKIAAFNRLGIKAEFLDEHSMRQAEPKLTSAAIGGILVHEDATVYAPVAARMMLDRARSLGALIHVGRRAIRIRGQSVETDDGHELSCGKIVVAAGIEAKALVPGIPLRARKGQLAITDRGPMLCRHQLVELSYIKNAHGHADESVSFNVQPRLTGQALIGSSRSYIDETRDIDRSLMRSMLDRAVTYLPDLAERRILRMWTGFRAATPDSLPLIGPHPNDESLLLATGHEGLGLTTSLGTAHLIAFHVLRCAADFDHKPFLPGRLADKFESLRC